MDWLGLTHLSVAILAIVLGAIVCLTRKGTPRHRLVGRAYGVGMLAVNVTALMIYDLFGRFGPFHYAAMVSLLGVVAGWVSARRRTRSGWLEYHAYWMAWSYVGLLAAAAAEVFSRVPEAPFWGGVLFGTLVVMLVGAFLIRRHLPRILAGFGRGLGSPVRER